MRHTHTQAGVQTHVGAVPTARTARTPAPAHPLTRAGVPHFFLLAMALTACGSAPDPFTAAMGEYDAGAAGTRPELRRVDVLGAGGATATAAGGSTVTQGDAGPMRASGGAASPAGATGAGGMIAAGGATVLDAGGKQASGGAAATGGSTGAGGSCSPRTVTTGCAVPFQGNLCGPQPDGCGGLVQCPVCAPTCDANRCPGPCPVNQATGLREALCCKSAIECGCITPDTSGIIGAPPSCR